MLDLVTAFAAIVVAIALVHRNVLIVRLDRRAEARHRAALALHRRAIDGPPKLSLDVDPQRCRGTVVPVFGEDLAEDWAKPETWDEAVAVETQRSGGEAERAALELADRVDVDPSRARELLRLDEPAPPIDEDAGFDAPLESAGAIDTIARARALDGRVSTAEAVAGMRAAAVRLGASVDHLAPPAADPSPAPSCHVDGACVNGPECWVCAAPEDARARAQATYREGLERIPGAGKILPREEELEDAPKCGGCGEPAQGHAAIGDDRYCHEGPSPTCYERASHEQALGVDLELEAAQEVAAAIDAGVADADRPEILDEAEADPEDVAADRQRLDEEAAQDDAQADAEDTRLDDELEERRDRRPHEPARVTSLPVAAPAEGGADKALAALAPGQPTPAPKPGGRGIDSPIPIGWHDLNDAAGLTGVPKATLSARIADGTILPEECRKHPSRGRHGYKWIVSGAAIERIRRIVTSKGCLPSAKRETSPA